MPGIRLHDLRHTHATLLLLAREPVHVVSQRLGHASPMVTLTIYAHVMPGNQRDAANTFARLVREAPEHEPQVSIQCHGAPLGRNYKPLTWENAVSEGGLEPPCPLRALAPQASASAYSATRTHARYASAGSG